MGITDLSCPNNALIFDEVRKQFVKSTPEEIVRQSLLQKMIHQLGYPKELIAVEKELKELPFGRESPVARRRIDIVCFAKGDSSLFPLIVIECKRGAVDTTKALNQVIGYNYFIKAPFVAVANERSVFLSFFDPIEQKPLFFEGLPSYHELIFRVSHDNS